jgi:putative hydrolase of the HAD superfamily
MIRCIAFDLDDTLWACQPVIDHAEHQLYAWLQKNTPIITRQYTFQALRSHCRAFIKDNPEHQHDLSYLRRSWLKQLANANGYSESIMEDAFQTFWLARNEVSFYAGTLSILASLKQRYSLGVISNGNADVHHIGVGHLFDFTVSAAEAGVAKPHPAIFELAYEKVTQTQMIKPEQILYVGDDPEKDVMGANRFGMKSAWFNPHKQTWKGESLPHIIVQNLAELQTRLNDGSIG